MNNKKTNVLLLVLLLIVGELFAQQSIKKDYELKEIITKDSLLIRSVYDVISWSENLPKGNSPHLFICHLFKKSENEFDMEVVYRPMYFEEKEHCFGYIKYRNFYFFMLGDFIENCFFVKKNSETFQGIASKDDINYPYVDSSEWLFYYKNEKFYLRLN